MPSGRGNPKVGFPRERPRRGASERRAPPSGNPHDFLKTHLSDTWEWDGNDWTQINPKPMPTPRQGIALAYDHARRCIVQFGGLALTPMNDTWEYGTTTPAEYGLFGAGCKVLALEQA